MKRESHERIDPRAMALVTMAHHGDTGSYHDEIARMDRLDLSEVTTTLVAVILSLADMVADEIDGLSRAQVLTETAIVVAAAREFGDG